ncbi:UDP-forming cellulose synthase catalytic subunit [Alteromonas sp. CYL-A6]|uniref:UDP-forming cellulose synthase catalytic subunit n=1 Tax=Alteromonas nitratireducens TaxID=3390813 RepID=UPI0034BD402E
MGQQPDTSEHGVKTSSFLSLSGLLLGSSVLLGLILAAPVDALGQLFAAILILALISLCSNEAGSMSRYRSFFRVLALMLGLALSIRYLLWRGMYTLTSADWASMIAVWLLFLAELYAGLTHVLGCIVNIFPLTRPQLTLDNIDPASLPTVDIMIPSYNEDEEILETTIRAARLMDYPPEKMIVHLLDDGGTDQKINQSNVAAAEAARQRRADLQALCERLGAVYHTRARNEHAKAGNVNSAFQNTHGELVVILDADHVPTSDFLSRTVPWMLKNDNVFLVQTPHFMANPDPVERNFFSAFTRMPSENDMFYGTIQKGLDYWSSSFFCGSAALMRRAHLEKVGGISGDSITEDAETALDLHKLGYESVYVDRPMVSGLAPETFDAFITQRMRWAQGMTQILLLKKPYKAAGLSWYQRVGYMSSIMFWLFPFARIVFLLMPLAYLVFGLQVYHASLLEILAYTLPHVIATYMLSTMLFGRTRWPLVSEIYELLQCTFTLNALVKVFMSPRAPSFVVTPKGKSLEHTFISPMSTVFYWLTGLLVVATGAGIYKLVTESLTRELTVVVLLWNIFNLLLMLCVMNVMVERRQTRTHSRLPASDAVTLVAEDDQFWHGELIDLSVQGAKLKVLKTLYDVPDEVRLVGWAEALKRNVELSAKVMHVNKRDMTFRLMFTPADDEEKNEVIAFTLCDSRRWTSFQRRRTRAISYWFGVKHLFSVGVKPALTHSYLLINKLWNTFFKRRKSANESL